MSGKEKRSCLKVSDAGRHSVKLPGHVTNQHRLLCGTKEITIKWRERTKKRKKKKKKKKKKGKGGKRKRGEREREKGIGRRGREEVGVCAKVLTLDTCANAYACIPS